MKSPQALRNERKFLPRIQNCGWHFSYMGGLDKVITKMKSGIECVTIASKHEKFFDENFLENAMREGVYFMNNTTYKNLYRCNVDEINLPTLKNFLKKYPYFVSNN